VRRANINVGAPTFSFAQAGVPPRETGRCHRPLLISAVPLFVPEAVPSSRRRSCARAGRRGVSASASMVVHLSDRPYRQFSEQASARRDSAATRWRSHCGRGARSEVTLIQRRAGFWRGTGLILNCR
jgi:hypothetical protein